jgi:uncharacterized protein with von Willebrand factor type A (vWA) domain
LQKPLVADSREHGYDVTESVVGLARTLRAAGVDAGPERVHATIAALGRLDAARRTDVYWAGRLTLCGSADDIARYDRVFTAYFGRRSASGTSDRVVPDSRLRLVHADDDGSVDAAEDDEADVAVLSASRSEVLRHRDIATLSPADRVALHRLLTVFRLAGESRRTRRTTAARAGVLDRHRTLRRQMGAGGEPARLAYRERRVRPRRLVLLVDVSGSMTSYADALLRFAHAASHRGRGPLTEVFTIGTRLTRVTRELGHRDPDVALTAIAQAVPDWSGGTRLGVLLKEFLDRWGQRGLARGAVVVVLSDGWERGDVSLLGEQMARLQRLAHRVVWANPRAGRPGFAPVAAGMAAALPYVDDFVSGHSLAALEELASVVSGGVVSGRRKAVPAYA